MITVASFYARRPAQYPDAPDYRPYLDLLTRSCQRLGLYHICITDAATAPSLPCATHTCDLPENLMLAFYRGWHSLLCSVSHGDFILVGADCLLNRDPTPLFAEGGFDLAVTARQSRPLNLGALYVSDAGRLHVADLLVRGAAALGPNPVWGQDQEVMHDLLAPVPSIAADAPPGHYIEGLRFGCRVRFLPMMSHNFPPARAEQPSDAVVVHFKGPRKNFMADWAARHLALA